MAQTANAAKLGAAMDPRTKSIVLSLLALGPIRTLFRGLTRLTHRDELWLRFARLEAERRYLGELGTQLAVQSGPFTGMRYANARAAGSALGPKLVGSYERELHRILERWRGRSFATIADVGCAEGYYAVGLALFFPQAVVHAFDTDESALALCRENAKLNGVSGQVVVSGHCGPDTLLALPLNGSLIVSDCEGYESELFRNDVLAELSSSHLIVEIHDAAGPDFGKHMAQRLSSSHDVEFVSTEPRRAGEYPSLAKFDPLTQRLILTEARDGVFGTKPQWWLVAEPRTAAS